MRKILELISTHDGQWGWYQLDRALSLLNHPSIREGNLMALLKKLEEKNLIEPRQITGFTQLKYSLTEKGKKFLLGEEHRVPKKEAQSVVRQLQNGRQTIWLSRLDQRLMLPSNDSSEPKLSRNPRLRIVRMYRKHNRIRVQKVF